MSIALETPYQGLKQLEILMLKFAIAAAVLFGGTAVTAAAPRHFAGAELLPQAKITLAQARQSAVRAHPGVITDQEKKRNGAAQVCATRLTSRTTARRLKLASMLGPERCSRMTPKAQIRTELHRNWRSGRLHRLLERQSPSGVSRQQIGRPEHDFQEARESENSRRRR